MDYSSDTKVSNKTIVATGIIFLVLFVIVFFGMYYKKNTISAKNSVIVTEIATIQKQTQDFFKDVSLEAQAVYVFDVNTGKVLFQRNAEAQMPLASLTKIMTAFTASHLTDTGKKVTIKERDIAIEGDSGLSINETWSFKKLLDFGLMVSSNDAMSAIAGIGGIQLQSTSTMDANPQNLFIQKMNANAKELGMTQTYFLNESGLDVSPAVSGGYGSAKDMSKLIEHILNHNQSLLEATEYDSLTISSDSAHHLALNTNKIINTIPGILGSKTGYTELSGGNLVVTFNAGLMDPVIITVLGSTRDGRFSDMEQLVDAVIKMKAE